MEKYLFTDGTNVIREVGSRQELQSLIQATSDTSKVRIWVFNSNEWITIGDFNKRTPQGAVTTRVNAAVRPTAQQMKPSGRRIIPSIIKKGSVGIASVAAIFMIYNFTRVTWRKASAVSIVAERPSNSPVVNVDSAISNIESLRGQKLDKITKTNLRIHNTWPDLVQLQLTADRDTSREGLRYRNMEISIDNSTGYNIDNAIVKLSLWKSGEATTDTLHFENITYAAPAKRKIEASYRGDSISVSFLSLRARSFNFCYSADKKNTYGNYNDRWYCK